MAGWNARRLGTRQAATVFKRFTDMGLDVIGLQECQFLQEGTDDTDMPYQLFRCDTGKAGIAVDQKLMPLFRKHHPGERYVICVFQGFLFVSLYLPHKDTLDPSGNWERQRDTVVWYQQLLLSMALAIQGLKKEFGIKHVIISMDANVEVFRNSVRDGFQVSGEATLGSAAPRRGGHEKQKHAIRTCMADALCTTMGALGLQLTNTFGDRRESREDVSSCTWRSQYGYEHVYDYLAIPRSWPHLAVTKKWLLPDNIPPNTPDTFLSDHKLLEMNVPQLSDMRSRKTVPAIPSFAKWRVPPGMEKIVARRFDHELAPSSHPFVQARDTDERRDTDTDERRDTDERPGEEDATRTNDGGGGTREKVDEFDVGTQAQAIRRTASTFPEGLQNDPMRPPSMTKEEVEVRNEHYLKHKQWKKGEITIEELRKSRRVWSKVRRQFRSRQVQYQFREGKKTRKHITHVTIDGVKTEDRISWERALRLHGLSRYADVSKKFDNDESVRKLFEKAEATPLCGNPITMGLLLRARARLKIGRAVGADGIGASLLKALPWTSLCMVLQAFQKLYARSSVTSQEWRMLCVTLLPKKNGALCFNETRAIVLLSVFSKWYSSCLAQLLERHVRSIDGHKHCQLYGFMPGRRTHEVTSGLKNLVRHTAMWGKSYSLSWASLDVAQAFDHFTIPCAAEAMSYSKVDPHLAYAVLEGYTNNMATLRFQEIETSDISWDCCIKTGSMEAPMLWILASIMIFEPVCAGWYERKLGYPLGTVGSPNDWNLTNMMWADNVYVFANTDQQLSVMIKEMTIALRRYGFQWKQESLMYMNTVSPEANGNLIIDTLEQPIALTHVQAMDVLGVRIDKRFKEHDDIHHRWELAEKTFWCDKSYYYDRTVPLSKKIARFCSRVQACFLYGIEGATVDANSLKFIHTREGGLLSKLLWRSKRRDESWSIFLTRRIRAGRELLRRAGRESLVQRVLRKQWEWAKDVSDSLCHVLPPPPPLLPCPSTASTPSNINNMQEEMEEEGSTQENRRQRHTRMMKEAEEEGRPNTKRRLPEEENPTQRSDNKKMRTPLSGNTQRIKDQLGNKPAPQALKTEKSDILNMYLQARTLMLVGNMTWTQQMDAWIKILGSQRAREISRRGGRGCSAHRLALHSWARIFESVGGEFWWRGHLKWTEKGWQAFCRQALRELDCCEQMFPYFVLKNEQPYVRKDEDQEMSTDPMHPKNIETSRRLAKIYERQSTWDFYPGYVSMELSGDSQVIVNWLTGLYSTSNWTYMNEVADVSNMLYDLTTTSRVIPPSAGHDIWKWVYREGNTRADRMTWRARRGQQERVFDWRFIKECQENTITISGIRGAFDGGVSIEGVGAGWVCDVYVSCVLPGSSFPPSRAQQWYEDVAFHSFSLPLRTSITSAELSAATQLLRGVQDIVRLCL